MIPVLTSVSGDRLSNTFTVTYGAAIDVTRTAEITLATTGTGTPVEKTVDLSQSVQEVLFSVAADPPGVAYTVSKNADGNYEVSPRVPTAGGNYNVVFTYGGSATSVEKTASGERFITLGSASGTFPVITQPIQIPENVGAIQRQDRLTFTLTDGTTTSKVNLIFTQEGTRALLPAFTPGYTITTDVDVNEVLSAAGGDIVADDYIVGQFDGF